MKSAIFIIGSELGIHARPAAEIVKISAKYNCKVILEANSKKADAKSVFMLLALGAKKGTELKLNVEGENEEKLFDELNDYIGNNFYEE
ncbi:MAG: HPr family phosphocarrier protein [Vallitalea sp.]|jgi:phosphotransferase system HPr (HPr) family protein|nr:HPr family phosphocarrier protein [Vallitalea sp.]